MHGAAIVTGWSEVATQDAEVKDPLTPIVDGRRILEPPAQVTDEGPTWEPRFHSGQHSPDTLGEHLSPPECRFYQQNGISENAEIITSISMRNYLP